MNTRSILECGSLLVFCRFRLWTQPAAKKAPEDWRSLKPWRVLVALLLLSTLSALSQYSVDWFTIDGGGGTSTGGVYAASGTIGQPDADAMSGDIYSVVGGFWSIIAIQTPGAPFLSIERTDVGVRISWRQPATGFVLDQAPAMTSPPAAISWSPAPFPYHTNGTHISILVSPLGNRFYRLRKL